MDPLAKKQMQQAPPHAVCFPLPLQGHINPMFKLAKLLHLRGIHITFIHTEHNIQRLRRSSSSSLEDTDHTFRFESITDGLPLSHSRGVTDLPKLCQTMPVHTLNAFRELMKRIPPVSCIIADGVMSCVTLDVAEEMGIPEWLFFTPSACGMLGYLQFEELVKTGLFPLKDQSYLSNRFLDRPIDWVPGWGTAGDVKLKHLPSFFRTTDPSDVMFNYNLHSVKNATRSQGIILNTFDAFEQDTLDIIKSYGTEVIPPNLYTIGPVSLLLDSQSKQEAQTSTGSLTSSLWKEETECLDWLDRRTPGSVVYANYGSLTVVSRTQMREFGWGLANSGCYFLWVIRPDMVEEEEEVVVSREYMAEVKERGLLLRWCPQERVLKHEAIGVFLTHCGWNSVLESVVAGVPMICWPFFAEQEMNCLYVCEDDKWGIGVEMATEEGEVRRERVEAVVREVMCGGGEKGDLIRRNVREWRRKAVEACQCGGGSSRNFDQLVKHLGGGHTTLD